MQVLVSVGTSLVLVDRLCPYVVKANRIKWASGIDGAFERLQASRKSGTHVAVVEYCGPMEGKSGLYQLMSKCQCDKCKKP